ncbi:hypothetical protein Pla110_25380 [Polystyrenella longa]|uniref:Cytochrome c domain-containing protein n=1 Tax=Polystyrenella longa TaxID=2528007 RepID=A0A518CNK7_9PLAN|nr:quinol:electron acceptor oxidoreductase subunit ActD [Polystyrenella longa]QDU80803.1 hypothetical protein Pla110_25380 [Polystyrenella longa]
MATMFDETTSTETVTTVEGVLAEYDNPHALMAAAEKVRDAGFKKWDAHTPFPLHGLDKAMGVRTSILPFLVLGGGFVGVVAALGLQYFTNAYDYRFMISGKPYFSLPASIPVTFELMILFSAFAAFFGMFALNQLPKFANALFHNERFLRVTSDRFFIVIEAADPSYNAADVNSLLQSTGAINVETYYSDTTETRFPKQIKSALITVALLAMFVPGLIIVKRNTTSINPRFHIVPDMDWQPYFKPQNTNPYFADDRAMRPQIEGTIARGNLEDDSRFYRGIEPGGEAELANFLNASFQEEPADGEEPPAADAVPVVDNTPWVSELPIEVNEVNMERGRQRYRIYCSTCHGLGGEGDGLITLRAQQIGSSTWVTPVQLSSESVVNQPVGKIFNTISHGIRKMPGYGSQIPVEDRWAIALYVRALQKSRTATEDQIPADVLNSFDKSTASTDSSNDGVGIVGPNDDINTNTTPTQTPDSQ